MGIIVISLYPTKIILRVSFALVLGTLLFVPAAGQATQFDLLGTSDITPQVKSTSRLLERRFQLVLSRHQATLNQALDRCASGERAACRLEDWQGFLSDISHDDETEQLYRVNRYINRFRYRTDRQNWKLPDFWAVPEQLFARGGDCEDYVIAKYLSLRALGIPAERMRVVVVYDHRKREDHAVLAVFGPTETMILDNRYARVLTWENLQDRYQPYYSLNEQAVWVHTTHI